MEEHITHRNMLNTVLDAHKTLMELNQSNQNMFEPLVKQLQKRTRQPRSKCHSNKTHNNKFCKAHL